MNGQLKQKSVPPPIQERIAGDNISQNTVNRPLGIWQNSAMHNQPPGQPPHIVVFDSGAGAFSVFQEIQQLEPGIICTLALDNAHFPYGTLAESQLIKRVLNVIRTLVETHTPDLVVIACNTASTLVLDELRQTFNLPFVGVVPAIKPAANLSSSQTIGLLATPATVQRRYTHNLIEDFAPHCDILKIGSTDLVYMAEQKLRGQAIDMQALENILAPFVDHKDLDTLVLACTHFPLLKDEIRQLLPARVEILDSGAAIAQRVSSLLRSAEERGEKPEDSPPNHQLYLTHQDLNMDAINDFSKTLGFDAAQVIGV